MTRFVNAVHISECRREEIAAANRIQPPRHFERVRRCGIKLGRVFADNVVLFSTNCAGFDLEHEIVLGKALKQLHGDVEILA